MGSLRFLNDLKTISKSVDKAHQTIVAFKTVQHRARWLPRKLASYKNLYHPNHDPAIYPRFVHWTIREYNLYTIEAYSHIDHLSVLLTCNWIDIMWELWQSIARRISGQNKWFKFEWQPRHQVLNWGMGVMTPIFSFSRLGLNCSWDSHVH